MASKLYLINRDCDLRRLKAIEYQMQQMNLSFERISAINAITMPRKELDQWRPRENDFYYIPRQLSKGEIGCFLSHRKCWEFIAQSNDRGGFIFEDDVHFSQDAKKFLVSDTWIPTTADLVQLSILTQEKITTYSTIHSVIDPIFQLLNISDPILYGTQGYWISRQTAKNALRMTSIFREPVDNFLFDIRHEFSQSHVITHLHPAILCRQENNLSIISQQRHTRPTVTNIKKETYFHKCIRKLKRLTKKRFTHCVQLPLLPLK